MATLGKEFVAAVYVTVQLPDESVHDEILNIPPALPSLNATIPDGIVEELEVSVTEIVRVTDPPTVKLLELGVMVTLVG